jgi:tetratricopeptide (TPR) repeat protein
MSIGESDRYLRRRSTALFTAGLVAVCTVTAFLPGLRNGFVNWDDPIYVAPQAASAWTAVTAIHPSGNWHPLATLSHRLDLLLWGTAPLGHHLTSILLHAINAGLVVLLGGALFTARARQADEAAFPKTQLWIALGLGALTWSIHPLRVESVAWVSERKDLLCGFFYLLASLTYLCHAHRHERPWYASWRYWAVLALFAAALASKPMAVTFPLLLLILDWFPLGRTTREPWPRLLAEKTPLFALSAAVALVTLHGQRISGAQRALAGVPGTDRAMTAVRALGGYLGKLLWPSPLLPYYSYPHAPSLLSIEVGLPAIVLVGLTVACIASVRRRPAILAAFASYLVILLPVLGIVQVGPQAMADRYTYLASIPIVLLAAAVVATRFAKALVAAPVVLGVLAWLTLAQIGVWHDSESLWTHELAFEPDNMETHNSRASYYYEQGRFERALADYDAALAAPTQVSARHAIKRRAACFNDRAITLVQLGRLEQAIADESEAIKLMPNQASYYVNRGKMYQQSKRTELAVADWELARRLSGRDGSPSQ